MAQEARCGLMLWDGVSRGTLNNVCELINSGKPALVYFSPETKFYKLAQPGDLEPMLSRCDQRTVEGFRKRLNRGPEQIRLHTV